MVAAGIDGCKAGWLVILNHHGRPAFYLMDDISAISSVNTQPERIFIDIPIGLSSTEASRECDRQLRDKLGSLYRSSVFNPPVRQALYCDSYRDACDINERITGKRLSRQSWNISSKIREVDQWLENETGFRNKMYESHPEWGFMTANGGNPLPHKKKTREGKKSRLDLLEQVWPGSVDFYEEVMHQTHRRDVASDDIFDAMILSYLATISLKNGIYSFPEEPVADSAGLPMGIYYTRLNTI